MSIKVMSQVWEHQCSREEQAILLALADHAADDGSGVRPGTERIAWKTGYSGRHVRRIVTELRDRGVLEMVSAHRRNRPAEYRIHLEVLPKKVPYRPPGSPDTTSTQEAVDNRTPRPPNSETQPDTTSTQDINDRTSRTSMTGHPEPNEWTGVSTEPSRNVIEPSVKTKTYVDPRFDEFWSVYPTRNGKKLDKAKAVRAWDKLSETDRITALEGIPNYRRACDQKQTLAKDAFRWLRDHSFEDWLTPAKPDSFQNFDEQEYASGGIR